VAEVAADRGSVADEIRRTMNTQADMPAIGLFEPRYVAFLETITHLRPRLHRYCARMTGPALDGEDVMQEAVFEAYRKLDRFDDSRALALGFSGSPGS
jgi:RNA polymerase sigma-70 factor (ECF subfamily)